MSLAESSRAWYWSRMRLTVRLLLIALLAATTQCDAPLDPGACHTGNRNVCPWCGESCRYGRELDPDDLGPCGMAELPELDAPATSSSSEGVDDASDSTGEAQEGAFISGE